MAAELMVEENMTTTDKDNTPTAKPQRAGRRRKKIVAKENGPGGGTTAKPAAEEPVKPATQLDVAALAKDTPRPAGPASQAGATKPTRRRSAPRKTGSGTGQATKSDAGARAQGGAPEPSAAGTLNRAGERQIGAPPAADTVPPTGRADVPVRPEPRTPAEAAVQARPGVGANGATVRSRRRRGRRDAGSAAAKEPQRSVPATRHDTVKPVADRQAPAAPAASVPRAATAPTSAAPAGKGSQGETAPAKRPGGRRGRRGGRGRHKDALDDAGAARARPTQATPARAPTASPPASSSPAAEEREMVINVSGGDECRIAVLQNGRLEELFIERASSQSHVGNIYKGRVTNVEPSIQAVFVDFGKQKNGFLHISDVQSQYFPDHDGDLEDVGRKIPRFNRPPIQKCFRRGQEVIVQVTKEGVGTKGPTLTTYLSIPGRFLVMMPGMSRHGVSRKIEDETDRRKMRDLMDELELPPDMGFIMRTAGLDRSKRELQRDLNYLLRLWKTVVGRIKRQPAPTELYQESDLVTRTIRDVYTADFQRIVVDDPSTAKKVTEFLQIAMPRTKADVDLYTDREPLFHRMGIEAEIERINMRQVPLPLGGSLVIESTEALVAIDVNSGRFRSIDDAEESALRINLEAAREIARQLRLRDLGGLIICDFIDMRLDRNKRAVERALRDALKMHKERARTLRMSAFGLIEMTRQRQGPSIKRNIYFDCPHCKGAGMVKMPESVVLDVMRTVQLAAHRDDVQSVTVRVANNVAFQMLNNKRAALSDIESETGKIVTITGDPTFTSDQVDYVCEDALGRPVPVPGAVRPENAGGRTAAAPAAAREPR